MSNENFITRLEKMKIEAILIKEILIAEKNIIFVKIISDKYKSRFGENKSTWYQNTRLWFIDLEKVKIIKQIKNNPLIYFLNEDYREYLKEIIKFIDKIAEHKRKALTKEVIKNEI